MYIEEEIELEDEYYEEEIAYLDSLIKNEDVEEKDEDPSVENDEPQTLLDNLIFYLGHMYSEDYEDMVAFDNVVYIPNLAYMIVIGKNILISGEMACDSTDLILLTHRLSLKYRETLLVTEIHHKAEDGRIYWGKSAYDLTEAHLQDTMDLNDELNSICKEVTF